MLRLSQTMRHDEVDATPPGGRLGRLPYTPLHDPLLAVVGQAPARFAVDAGIEVEAVRELGLGGGMELRSEW